MNVPGHRSGKNGCLVVQVWCYAMELSCFPADPARLFGTFITKVSMLAGSGSKLVSSFLQPSSDLISREVLPGRRMSYIRIGERRGPAIRQCSGSRAPAVIDDQQLSDRFVALLKFPKNEFISGIPRL